MQPNDQTLRDDEPLAPTDAHEVLIDVTGGNQPVPDDEPAHEDARDESRESQPHDAEEVSESSDTAERLRSHAGGPSPPADAPGRLTGPE